MAKRALAVSVTLALACLSAPAFAQDGTGIQAGPFRVKPTVGLSFGHDSNVARTRTNEIDSFVTTISPGVRLESGDESRNFALSYELDAARYEDSDIDNYVDHRVSAIARFAPSARTALDVQGNYERGHDRRGENSRQGNFANFGNLQPDEWNLGGVQGGVKYGVDGARASVAVRAGTESLEYQNNRSYTRFADRDKTFAEGVLGFRIAPKTSAFLSVRGDTIEYDFRRSSPEFASYSLDSDERAYMLGLEFDATAKTAGRIAAGRIEKDFNDGRLEDYSGTGWQVGVQFRPRTYSIIDLSTSRRTDEAVNFNLGIGPTSLDTDYVIARDITLAWTHGWNDRIHTTLDLGTEQSDYIRRDRAIRDDKLSFFGVSADYKLRSWLSIGAGYKTYTNDSSQAVFEYDRDEFVVSFEGSL